MLCCLNTTSRVQKPKKKRHHGLKREGPLLLNQVLCDWATYTHRPIWQCLRIFSRLPNSLEVWRFRQKAVSFFVFIFFSFFFFQAGDLKWHTHTHTHSWRGKKKAFVSKIDTMWRRGQAGLPRTLTVKRVIGNNTQRRADTCPLTKPQRRNWQTQKKEKKKSSKLFFSWGLVTKTLVKAGRVNRRFQEFVSAENKELSVLENLLLDFESGPSPECLEEGSIWGCATVHVGAPC